jgi:hypothetical protein
MSLYKRVIWSPGRLRRGSEGLIASTRPEESWRLISSIDISLPAKGVTSRSTDAIVVCCCEEEGDLAKRTRQRNDGAARKSRRGPHFSGRTCCIAVGVVGLGLDSLRADILGVRPPSAGSFANG